MVGRHLFNCPPSPCPAGINPSLLLPQGCSNSHEHQSDDEDDEVFVEQLHRQTYKPPGLKLPEDLAARYQLRALIGRGAFSEVVRADDRSTRQPFAIKILERTGVADDEATIASEVAVLHRLRHPNVIRLYEVYETSRHAFLVMELATGGDLFERLVERGVFTERQSSRAMQQILQGVAYLHDHGVAHRDLKLENVLCQHPGSDARLIISDFGFAHRTEPKSRELLKTTCGSPEYIAPEILTGNGYTRAVDIWSAGVIAYALLAGYLPFDEDSRPVLFRKIKAGDYNYDDPVSQCVLLHAPPFFMT